MSWYSIYSPTAISTTRSSDKLRANILLKQYYLEVDLQHVGLYNEELAHAIQDQPGEIMPLVSIIPILSGILTQGTC